MKLLLSAYACNPYKGSEHSVGWKWVESLQNKNIDLYVLTRLKHKEDIERFISSIPLVKTEFIYYDCPRWLTFWKKNRRGIHLYYLLWQLLSYFKLKKLYKNKRFDLIHHVTFATIRLPSFLTSSSLGSEFIFGPVGGGERAPLRMIFDTSAKNIFYELGRIISNLLVLVDPLMLSVFRRSNKIYVTTQETKGVVPSRYHHKVEVLPAISIDSKKMFINRKLKDTLKLLYVGQLNHIKAVDVLLLAVKQIRDVIDLKFTVVGSGPELENLKKISKNKGIEDIVFWEGWKDRSELESFYMKSDIFITSSIHDSGGLNILEAMSYSLPVVALDVGGPSDIIGEKYGILIEPGKKNKTQIAFEFGSAIKKIYLDPKYYTELSIASYERVKKYSSKYKKQQIYGSLIK